MSGQKFRGNLYIACGISLADRFHDIIISREVRIGFLERFDLFIGEVRNIICDPHLDFIRTGGKAHYGNCQRTGQEHC